MTRFFVPPLAQADRPASVGHSELLGSWTSTARPRGRGRRCKPAAPIRRKIPAEVSPN